MQYKLFVLQLRATIQTVCIAGGSSYHTCSLGTGPCNVECNMHIVAALISDIYRLVGNDSVCVWCYGETDEIISFIPSTARGANVMLSRNPSHRLANDTQQYKPLWQ